VQAGLQHYRYRDLNILVHLARRKAHLAQDDGDLIQRIGLSNKVTARVGTQDTMQCQAWKVSSACTRSRDYALPQQYAVDCVLGRMPPSLTTLVYFIVLLMIGSTVDCW
jgi:hypothetical protein